MGDYLCVASNGIPPSTSKKYRIRVQCKFLVDVSYGEFGDMYRQSPVKSPDIKTL